MGVQNMGSVWIFSGTAKYSVYTVYTVYIDLKTGHYTCMCCFADHSS